MFRTFDYLARIPSTNDYLKDFVAERRPRYAAARLQTQGKGRHGRLWIAAADESLCVSYLLFPEWSARQAPYFNRLAALSVVDSIRASGGTGLDLRIKLPNDVLIGGRKACGILTELSTQGDRILWAVLGIGVNLGQTSFPSPLEVKATSLRLEGVEDVRPPQFCRRLTASVQEYWGLMSERRWREIDRRFDGEQVIGSYPAIC